MTQRLRAFWNSATPRQRRAAGVIAVVASLALYGWVVWSAEHARGQLEAGLADLREQAARLERSAAEHERLRAVPRAPESSTDMGALLRTSMDAAGLARAVVKIEAQDGHRMRLVFGAVAYADWLAWIERLQAHRIRVETCRIEALASPGLVNATATLVRAGAS
jgi:type II secretory pathway component PulM